MERQLQVFRPISVPSPAHARAGAQGWFGIVRSTKAAPGRDGQTRRGQTAIRKLRSNAGVWEKLEATSPTVACR